MISTGFIGFLLGLILLATCLLVLYSLLEIVWKTHCIEGRAAGVWVVGFVLLIIGAFVYRPESRLALRELGPEGTHSVWVNWDSFLLLALGLLAFVIGLVINIRAFDDGKQELEEAEEAPDAENTGK